VHQSHEKTPSQLICNNNVDPADPAADPFSSTETEAETATIPFQVAMIGKLVSAQYVRSGAIVNDSDPAAEPSPLTVQLWFEDMRPLKPGELSVISAPKFPLIFDSRTSSSNETAPWISSPVTVAVALPLLIAPPEAVAVVAAEQPSLAAQLPPIVNAPLPTAASMTDRAHAGNVPCHCSVHPPEYCAT